MASRKHLKNKLRAVKNIAQITEAMQTVTAIKMRKSQETALRSRPYAKKALSLLLHILQYSKQEDFGGIFWENRNDQKLCLIVVSSDKGLCGGFNAAILQKALAWKDTQEKQGKTVDIVAVGKKAKKFFESRNARVVAGPYSVSDILTLYDMAPITDWMENAFGKRDYDKIFFCSTHFISAFVQIPEVRQILPLNLEEINSIIAGIIPKTGKYSEWKDEEAQQEILYTLEPSAKDISEKLVKDLIKIGVVHLLFESNAAEHSARMMAMKSAHENALKIINNTTRTLNKEAQNMVTQELSELSSAREALIS